MKKVIITGATGTIGMALIRRCMENNIRVLAIVNPKSTRKECLPEHPLLEIIEKDISEYDSLVLEESYDVWFHLAWLGASGSGRNDMYVQNSNVAYLLDAIHAAKRAGCETFIGAGSQAEYGPSDVSLSADSPTFPHGHTLPTQGLKEPPHHQEESADRSSTTSCSKHKHA